MSRLVPTLVYGDLRGAGHELLSRGDLDLHWALTLHEALAVSRKVELDLVLASDDFALAYLKARAELKHQAPVIALLGPDHADQKEAFKGATALVSGTDPERVVEAISELTGLTFRDHARVPLHTVVDVQFKESSHLLYTFDLSVSGVCIRDFPSARYGDRAKITFDLFDPPLSVDGMVVRTFNLPEAKATGLCFMDLAEADRARLAELVKQELVGLPMFETTDLLDAPGEQTIDLLTALGQKTDGGLSDYHRMVKGIIDGWEDDVPAWLFEIAGKLTETERKAITTDLPDWARAAVGFRIDLKRQVVDRTNLSFDFASAMEFCQAMANETSSATEEQAVDATLIRSAVLRAVYVLHRHMKEREAQTTRANRKR